MTVDVAEKFGLYRVGSHELPALVFDLFYSRQMTDPADVAFAVSCAWSSSHLPAANLPIDIWIELFQVGGYTEDGMPAERPSEPVTLYRSSTPGRVHRLAWTASLSVAQRFLEINEARYGKASRFIYTVTVEPERLLAHITDRDEDEYVTDTRGLRSARVPIEHLLGADR